MLTLERVRSNVMRLSTFTAVDAVKHAFKPRAFHAYCVGSAKSGTHSIAGLLSANFRSAHEPGAEELIALKHMQRDGSADHALVDSFLRKRDLRLALEMESSDFAGYFVEDFCRHFPRAKFILTIRSCYSFLNSIINHQIAHPVDAASIWRVGRDLNYLIDRPPHDEEVALRAEYPELYSVRGYLQYWAERNRHILDTVPASRLLVVRTEQLGESLGAIARFLNIPATSIQADKAHAFKGTARINVLERLSQEWLDTMVEDTGCRTIMTDIFG